MRENKRTRKSPAPPVFRTQTQAAESALSSNVKDDQTLF